MDMKLKQLSARGIVAISDLKISPAAIVKQVDVEGPVVVTQEGRAAMVCVSPEGYDELVLWASIGRSSADSRAGRTIAHGEMKKRIAAKRAVMESGKGAKKAAK